MIPTARHLILPLFVVLSACGDEKPAQPEPANTATVAATSTTSPPTASVAAVESAAPTSTGEGAQVVPEGSGAPSTSAVAKVTPTGATPATAAPTASADPEANKGNETKGATFTAYMAGAKSYKAGQPGTVTAIVSSLGEYHINQEYPYKMTLDAPPPGISYPEKVVRNVSRTEKRASISIPFTADKAGTATITGTCSLSVCTKDACVIEKVPLSVAVKVE